MTTVTGTAVGILAALVVLLGAAAARTRSRLAAVQRHVAALESRVATLDAATGEAVDTARTAATLARRATAGEPEPPPRVVLEPVTGRVVKALAAGAGARRVVTRLARSGRSGA